MQKRCLADSTCPNTIYEVVVDVATIFQPHCTTMPNLEGWICGGVKSALLQRVPLAMRLLLLILLLPLLLLHLQLLFLSLGTMPCTMPVQKGRRRQVLTYNYQRSSSFCWWKWGTAHHVLSSPPPHVPCTHGALGANASTRTSRDDSMLFDQPSKTDLKVWFAFGGELNSSCGPVWWYGE